MLALHTTKCLQRNERKLQDLERVQPHCSGHSTVQSAISGCTKTAVSFKPRWMRTLYTFRKSSKTYENKKEVMGNVVINNPDNFTSLQFYLLQLNYLLLHYMRGIHVGYLSQVRVPRMSLCITSQVLLVSKRGYIFYKEIDCCVLQTPPHTHFTLRHKSSCDLYLLKIGRNKH